MKLRMIAEKKEKDKDFFDYGHLSSDMWRKKVSAERNSAGINFDLENDEAIAQREIVIPQQQWDFTKCKFRCELRSAGGDWQSPVLYFRCQLKDGYARRDGQSIMGGDSHFVFIPGPDDGNCLGKAKKGWTAPDSDSKDKTSQYKAWHALKTHRKQLVDDAMDEGSNKDLD